jgi:LuxR family transcriptional regulator, maltose regulon positive regulatory protein
VSEAHRLIQTKLRPPRARGELLPRPRLAALLPRVLESQLTLISAPAGFGKTTLLATWFDELARLMPAAWLSLDEDDSDPDRFARYLL